MKKTIGCSLALLVLLLAASPGWSGNREARWALIPGMGHFEAEQNYKGLAYAGSQVACLFLGIKAVGNRQAAVRGSQVAKEGIATTSDNQEAVFYNQRIEDFRKASKRHTLEAGIFLGGFAALYAVSIVDAWRIPAPGPADPSVSMQLGVGSEGQPVFQISKAF